MASMNRREFILRRRAVERQRRARLVKLAESRGLRTRLRKYANVHPFGFLDQPIHRTPRPYLPRALLRVSDKDLCDALVACELDDGFNGILALDHMHLGAQLPREVEILFDCFLGLTRQIALLDIDREQLRVEPAGR